MKSDAKKSTAFPYRCSPKRRLRDNAQKEGSLGQAEELQEIQHRPKEDLPKPGCLPTVLRSVGQGQSEYTSYLTR